MTKCLILFIIKNFLFALELCVLSALSKQATSRQYGSILQTTSLLTSCEMLTKAMHNFNPRICTYLDYHQGDEKHFFFFSTKRYEWDQIEEKWGNNSAFYFGPQCQMETPSERYLGHFPGGLVVKTLPSNAKPAGWVPGLGAKIPHASQPKNQNIKTEATL